MSETAFLPEDSVAVKVAPMAQRSQMQWARKLLHIFNGSLGFSLYMFSGLPESWVLLFCFSCFVGAFSFDWYRIHHKKLNEIYCERLSTVMREKERFDFNSMTRGLGAIFVILAIFPREIDVPVMIFMQLGDPIGCIVGTYWGRTKLNPHSSLQGSLAIMIFSALAMWACAAWFFPAFPIVGWKLFFFCVCAGMIAAFSEGFFYKWDDNLTLPLISAPLMWLLFYFFGFNVGLGLEIWKVW